LPDDTADTNVGSKSEANAECDNCSSDDDHCRAFHHSGTGNDTDTGTGAGDYCCALDNNHAPLSSVYINTCAATPIAVREAEARLHQR
jgi:hypothetical protein